jgi:hypothetical protein
MFARYPLNPRPHHQIQILRHPHQLPQQQFHQINNSITNPMKMVKNNAITTIKADNINFSILSSLDI